MCIKTWERMELLILITWILPLSLKVCLSAFLFLRSIFLSVSFSLSVLFLCLSVSLYLWDPLSLFLSLRPVSFFLSVRSVPCLCLSMRSFPCFRPSFSLTYRHPVVHSIVNHQNQRTDPHKVTAPGEVQQRYGYQVVDHHLFKVLPSQTKACHHQHGTATYYSYCNLKRAGWLWQFFRLY